jgi:thermitase
MRFRSPWFCGLLAAMVVSLIGSADAAGARTNSSSLNYVAGTVLVKLNPSADVRTFARDNGLDAEPASIEQLDKSSIYRLKIDDGLPPPRKANQLQHDPRVLYAEPNYEAMLPEARLRSIWVVGGDTFEYMAQWAPAKMRLPEAHVLSRGAGVTVAVLDTGVDLKHPTLANQLVAGYDFIDLDDDPSEMHADEATADPTEGSDGTGDAAFGHGTHVAGLIALAAPEARIMPLRTLRSSGIGTLWAQAQALSYAASKGVDVINLSFSFGQSSKLLNDLLAEITCARVSERCQTQERPGIVVVAAAGNSGASNREYPAAEPLPGVLAVGAATSDGMLAPFSTYGSWVNIAAPGDHILSTIPGGGYATWSGTSMAAPLTAGTVALMRSVAPCLRPADAVTRITTTGAPLAGPVRRQVDAAAALASTLLKHED